MATALARIQQQKNQKKTSLMPSGMQSTTQMPQQEHQSMMKTSLLATPTSAFLYIPSDIYGQIIGYCMGCKEEISGMGQLKPYEDGYIVTRIHLPNQECSSVETEMSDDDLGVLEYECEDGEFADDGELIWWWHSHVDMGTFWSTTDHAAIEQLSANGRVVATVFNRKFSMKTAYRQGASDDGFYPAIFSDDLKTVIVPSSDIEQQIEEKVKEQPRLVPTVNKFKGYVPPKSIVKHPLDLALDTMGETQDWIDAWDQTPEEEPVNIQERIRERHIGWLATDFDINDVLADDMCDDFEDMTGREPKNYLELKAYVKANYKFSEPKEV